MTRKTLPTLAALVLLMMISACSHSKPITIAITTPPPGSLEINNVATIAATVMHDSANDGVDWTCTPSPCGTFTPAHTASGATTVYQAGSTAESVTITAASTRKSTVTATATVTVTAVATNSTLTGSYTFYVTGYDASGDFYSAAGVVTLDGKGDVTGGEEDLNNTSYLTPVEGDALAGSYAVNNDGQGTMTLMATTGGVADTNVGVGGTQTLSFTVVNANHLLITEFDSADTSSGAMDMQSGAAVTAGFVGNYAIEGGGYLSGEAWSLGGVINSAAGTATGTADQDIQGGVLTDIATGGAVGADDASGRGSLTLGGITLTCYIVTTEAAYCTEVDDGGVTTVLAFGQGASPAFSATSISGEYVLDEPQPLGLSAFGPIALAGQFAATSSTTSISGVVDYNEGGYVDPGPGPDTITGTYTVGTNGYGSLTGVTVSNNTDFTTYGVYMTDPALNINDPNNTSGGGGALIVELDADDLGSGFIVPQTATSLSTINEAVSFSGVAAPDEVINATGQIAFTGQGSFAGTNAVNDFNYNTETFTETSGVTLTGTSTADTTNAGRYTVVVTIAGTITNNRVTYVASGGFAATVDVDSSDTLVEVGSDLTEGQQ